MPRAKQKTLYTDESNGTMRQSEIPHARGKVGHCPFCQRDNAELWFDPNDPWKPFQVRCASCGACGPWCDCGWESAVPAWQKVTAERDDYKLAAQVEAAERRRLQEENARLREALNRLPAHVHDEIRHVYGIREVAEFAREVIAAEIRAAEAPPDPNLPAGHALVRIDP